MANYLYYMFIFSENEWVFRDGYGGVSILDVKESKTREIISNHTFVSTK
jgi:hypothetical protein